VLDLLGGLRQRACQHGGPFPIVLHQVIGHSLRRLRPDARQAAQRFGKEIETRGRFHLGVVKK
jgi:hypothetical protein